MIWSYIADDYITIPAAVYKNGRDHVLPNLVAPLTSISRKSSDSFPSRNGSPLVSFSVSQAPA